MKRGLYTIGFLCLSITAVLSGFRIVNYLVSEQKMKEEYAGLASEIAMPALKAEKKEASGGAQIPDPAGSIGNDGAASWTFLDQYGALFEKNSDMIGWLSIPGTVIDYPVMQTPEEPDFYLHRNFNREYSPYGVLYAEEECSIAPQSDNITVYGHNMKNGTMYGSLEKYKEEEFYKTHPKVQFDTLAGFGVYEIIGVFKISPEEFPYHRFIDASDPEEFDEYVNRVKELSFYETGIAAEYGDKLITLSTCEYTKENNRLVVVAKISFNDR